MEMTQLRCGGYGDDPLFRAAVAAARMGRDGHSDRSLRRTSQLCPAR